MNMKMDKSMGDMKMDKSMGDKMKMDKSMGDMKMDKSMGDMKMDKSMGDMKMDKSMGDMKMDKSMGDMKMDKSMGDMKMDKSMGEKTWLPNTYWMPPMNNVWSFNDFYQLFVMWAIMMIAMMSPSIVGSVLMYAKVNKAKIEQGLQYTPTFIFYFGYLIAWVIYSLVISIIQYPLQLEALMNPMLASVSQTLSAIVLIIAGIYQFTPYKNACLDKCRSPLSLIMAQWQDGPLGALKMGLSNGFYCVFCCWFLMAILLVAGVMNMTFVVILTLFVLLEKLLPVPDSMESLYFKVITTVPGILLIAWGISFLI